MGMSLPKEMTKGLILFCCSLGALIPFYAGHFRGVIWALVTPYAPPFHGVNIDNVLCGDHYSACDLSYYTTLELTALFVFYSFREM